MNSNNEYIKSFIENLTEKERNNLYILAKKCLKHEFEEELLGDVLQVIINKLTFSKCTSNQETLLENIRNSLCSNNVFKYEENNSINYENINTKLFFTLKKQMNSNKLYCPCCGKDSSFIVKNGLSNLGKQRFKCKCCNKIFSSSTKSTLWYSKKSLLIWLNYIKCMIQGLTIIESANRCKISKNTSFYWRHKILNAINVVTFSKLSGTVEVAENRIKKCNKGNHSKKYKLELSKCKNSFVSFTVCKDRNLNVLPTTLALGNPTYQIVEKAFKNKFANSAILYSRNNSLYKNFAKNHNLQFKTITSNSLIINKRFHIRNAINFSIHVKNLDSGFFRVATKYLSNYSCWITMYEYTKKLSIFKRLVGWLMVVFENNKGIRIKDLKLFKNPIAT